MATIAAYANTLRGPFVFDDTQDILQNPAIRRLWPLWPLFLVDVPDRILLHGRPIVTLSFAVNYAIGGLEPFSYHLANLAIHVLAGLTLFGIVRRTLSLPGIPERYSHAATPLAFAIASLWALHPLQTQAVTYVVQRYESMMGLFYLLSLYCAIRAGGSTHPRCWAAASIASCLLAMGCKEVAVSAPLVILLYDRAFLAGSFREAWRRRWGMYLGLAAVWAVFAMVLVLTWQTKTEWAGFGLKHSPLEYFATQWGVILHYLRLSFWPNPLVLDYGWPVARTAQEILPGVEVVGGLLLATAWAVWRHPKWGVVGAWFFLILAPSSSIMPITDLAFEHRMYLSLAAVVTATVIGGYELLERLSALLPATRWTCLALMTTVLVALGAATYARNLVYQDQFSIWSDTVQKAPHNARAQYNLGYAYQLEGMTEEAAAQFRKALELRPDYPPAHNNLGIIAREQGRPDEAIAHYQKALEARPDYAAAHYNWGIAAYDQGRHGEAIAHCRKALELRPIYPAAQNNLGIIAQEQGRPDEAIAHYRSALDMDPEFSRARMNLANLLFDSGRRDEAMQHYRIALKADPQSAEDQRNLGDFLRRQGKPAEAIDHYQKALALDSRLADVHNSLANALCRLGRFEEAVTHFQAALQVNPAYVDAHYNLANALSRLGKADEAIVHYQRALQLRPRFAEAHNNLASLLGSRGRFEEAVAHGCKALEIRPQYLEAHCNLAVVLCAQGRFAEAVPLAERASQLSGGRVPEVLDMLAAAYAKAGRLAEAIATARRAVQLASAQGNKALADALQERIKLYESGTAAREGRSSQASPAEGGRSPTPPKPRVQGDAP